MYLAHQLLPKRGKRNSTAFWIIMQKIKTTYPAKARLNGDVFTKAAFTRPLALSPYRFFF